MKKVSFMKDIKGLRKVATQGIELLNKVEDIKEAEVFVAVNDRFVGRLNYTSGIPSNGLQEPKSNAYSGTGVAAVFQTKEGLKVGFGSEDKEISLGAVKKALAKARRAAIADENFKSFPKPTTEMPRLENYHDPKVMNIKDEDLSRKTWEALEGALKTFQEAGYGKADALSITGDITIIREKMAVANTHGINDCDQSTILMVNITAMIESKNSKGSGWTTGTHLDKFDAYGAGQMAAKSAISTVGGQRIKSGSYNVILGHQATCVFFSGLIVPCMELDGVVLKISPLADQLDKKVMSDLISIYDDGSIPGEMTSKRITCEGLPTGRVDLVDRGRLVGLLSNNYFSNQVGDPRFIPRNGFRFGGGGRWHRMSPHICATNVVIEGREKAVPAKELLKKVKNGVFIGRLWYLYPINGMGSGDFTGTIVGDSYLIKDGEIVNPLSPNVVRINDNWLKLMKENVLGVSEEKKSTLVWAAEEVVIAPQIALKDVELEEIDILMDQSFL